MASTFAVNSGVGANFAERTKTPKFALGTPATGNEGGGDWVYVKASEAVATGTCTVSAAFVLTDAAGTYTADTAFAADEYGWVHIT